MRGRKALISISKAIVSVSDKDGILEFASGLEKMGVKILASDGTARFLKEKGIEAESISDYTGQEEVLGGRVKTLHPKVFASILATTRQLPELKRLGWEPIDMVVVNLYPFESTIAKPGTTFQEAMENVDIGGVSLIRASAKNSERVAVITDKTQYAQVLDEMMRNGGCIGDDVRNSLALAAFKYTSSYDSAIYRYLNKRSGDKKSG